MPISMIPFTPSLVQVKTKPVFKALKGQRVKGIAMLYDQNQLIENKQEKSCLQIMVYQVFVLCNYQDI